VTLTADFLNGIVLLGLSLLAAISYFGRAIIKGRAHYERVEKQGSSPLLGTGMMEAAHWTLQPMARLLALIKVTPDQVSWSALLLGFCAAYALATGHFGVGATFSVAAGFADVLDGMLARLTGKSSDAGQILDAAIDRYVEFLILGGLIVYYHPFPLLQVVTLFALLGSFMVSYSTAKAEAMQVKLPSRAMRRPERAFYLTLGAALSAITIPTLESSFEGSQTTSTPFGYPMVAALILVAVMGNIVSIKRLGALTRLVRARESSAR
jgi:CDP-diacylglycerol--glycerol-3-phosphate 3-phosphatidyltransferase